MAAVTIRAGRTLRFGRLHVGFWRPRYWTLGARVCTESSFLVLSLGPLSIRIAR